MYVRNSIVFIIIITISLGLISCNPLKDNMKNKRLNMLNSSDDNKNGTECLDKILDALENKDEEKLKKMFSVSALKEAADIDGRIDYLMDFFKGKVISTKGSMGEGSMSSNDGVKAIENNYYYTVETNENKYIIFFIYISKDTFNPENVGMYMLQIINENDKEREYDGGQAIRCPGIYYPSATKYTDLRIEEGTEIDGGFKVLKYEVDNNDGNFNIFALIRSNIAYCNINIAFCFFDRNGKKIGVAMSGTRKLEAGGMFEIKMHATDYKNNPLKYENIASYKFFGIDAF